VLRGVVLIALAAVAWGTTGSVSTVLVQRAGAEPLLIGTVRLWLAALLLLPAAGLGGGSLRVGRRALVAALGMGAAMAAYQAFYFTAVTAAGIVVAALVAICSAPLMIAALAALFLGERLTARVGLALVLAVGGTGLLVAAPGAGAAPGPVAGTVLALGAGLAYAVYAVTARAFVRRTSALGITALSFAAAALLSTPLGLRAGDPVGAVARGWPWLLYLGGVATAGAYALYARGLTRVPAAAAGVVTLMEPLTATLLGVLVFGERLGATGLAGAALLLGAIGLLLAAEAPGRPAHVTPPRPESAGTPRG
jgi:DME family drug/metabolite transporter